MELRGLEVRLSPQVFKATGSNHTRNGRDIFFFFSPVNLPAVNSTWSLGSGTEDPCALSVHMWQMEVAKKKSVTEIGACS